MSATCCCKTNHSKMCGLKQQPFLELTILQISNIGRQQDRLGGSCGCCLAPSWECGELHASPVLFPWHDRDARVSERNRGMLKQNFLQPRLRLAPYKFCHILLDESRNGRQLDSKHGEIDYLLMKGWQHLTTRVWDEQRIGEMFPVQFSSVAQSCPTL